jgi:serine/threonine-protein kinase RsbW
MYLRATPAGATGALTRLVRLPHAPEAVALGRRRVRAELEQAGLTRPLLDDIEMVVSELLGNAVRHARPLGNGFLLSWRIGEDEVVVQVTDGGSRQPVRPLDGPALSESGRGLRIVDRLSREWGVCEDPPGGQTVWARFPVDR